MMLKKIFRTLFAVLLLGGHGLDAKETEMDIEQPITLAPDFLESLDEEQREYLLKQLAKKNIFIDDGDWELIDIDNIEMASKGQGRTLPTVGGELH